MLIIGIAMVLQSSNMLDFIGAFLIVTALQIASWALDQVSTPNAPSNKFDSINGLHPDRKQSMGYSANEFNWSTKSEEFANLVEMAVGNRPPEYSHLELRYLSLEVGSSVFQEKGFNPEGALIRAFAMLEDAIAESLSDETSTRSKHSSNLRISRHKILSELKNRGKDIPPEAVEAFELLWEMRNRAAHKDDGTSPSRKTVMKILDATLELEGLLAGRPA